tara:strand:+ start:224 stop:598 length:375 start_codon:yes stop_codon:yes gene_type:complete
MKKIIHSSNAPEAIGPYSQAVFANNTLYCSGQIALDKNGALVNGNISDETKQVINNIREVLKAAKMDFTNVVKSTIFLKNIQDFNVVNKIYEKVFDDSPPARETVEVSNLPKNVNIEISVIACL